MTEQPDIHLYTASTMNGWKPVIFLEEAEVEYDMTVTVPEGYGTICCLSIHQVCGKREGADNPNRLARQASVK